MNEKTRKVVKKSYHQPINQRLHNKQPVLLQPATSKEPHPYPYIKSPDVYLLKFKYEEKENLSKPLPEEVIEKLILDSKFGNEFIEEFVSTLIEPEVREISLSFTKRQGPANMPSTTRSITDFFKKKTPTKLNKDKKSTEDPIIENIIMEEIKICLGNLLWHCLDEKSVFLEDKTYDEIAKNDRGYSISLDLVPKLNRHCILIAQGIKKKKWPTTSNEFKDVPTRNYIYNLHKCWKEHMNVENYAVQQLRLQFINEAIWHHLLIESVNSTKESVKKTDLEESRSVTLISK